MSNAKKKKPHKLLVDAFFISPLEVYVRTTHISSICWTGTIIWDGRFIQSALDHNYKKTHIMKHGAQLLSGHPLCVCVCVCEKD